MQHTAELDALVVHAGRRILRRESERIRRFAEMRWRFLRDLNWLLMDVKRGAQAQMEQEGEVPALRATLEWARREQKKLWPNLCLFCGPESGKGQPEIWARIIAGRYRQNKRSAERKAA